MYVCMCVCVYVCTVVNGGRVAGSQARGRADAFSTGLASSTHGREAATDRERSKPYVEGLIGGGQTGALHSCTHSWTAYVLPAPSTGGRRIEEAGDAILFAAEARVGPALLLGAVQVEIWAISAVSVPWVGESATGWCAGAKSLPIRASANLRRRRRHGATRRLCFRLFFVAVDAAPRLLTCTEPSSPNGPFDFLSSSPTPFLLRLLPPSLACSAVGGPRCRMLHYWMGCRSPVSAKTPSQTSRQTEACQETSGATPGATPPVLPERHRSCAAQGLP
jgi:hypothetical protein